ncbi:chemoreceptor glutamine deamidase CheD [soil metagenome]
MKPVIQSAAHAASSGTATHFYHDRAFDLPAAKVLPGEYQVSADDMVLTTVLGSCVSACIWDRAAGVGGMNHFMLPDTGEPDATGAAGRYGVYAMELLINELMKRGARRERLEAKLFGGGNVMRNFTTLNVGERNAAFAEKFLETERIRVTARDLLDIFPRKVAFFSKSGRALVKKLREDTSAAVGTLESRYRQTLQVAKPVVAGGDVDLF